ncbi:MAG: phenylalanine--tRNA ligase subunit alpha [Candidatus Bathyarchaeota archaeon]|nr:phenylalanine--tRNA ligase subunit alpha [Candidatus Bathyarchaeota archaeon]
MVELREQERQLMLALKDAGGASKEEQLIKHSKLPSAAIMRAAMALRERNLITIRETKQTSLVLREEGKYHAKKGLPERRLITALEKLEGKATCNKVYKTAKLEKKFAPIALGWSQRKKWTTLDSKANILQLVGKPEKGSDEKLLELLKQKGNVATEELVSELRDAVQILKSRKLLDIEEKTSRIIELTEAGKNLLKRGISAFPEVTQLTQELIVSGKWRNIRLQKYNIQAPVAKTWPGKKHPYLQFLEKVREKLVTLGFREMTGTAVELAFFNFDALYTPQDHPAREASSIYYVKSPKEGSLDSYQKALRNVKRTHEDGWRTASSGWQYSYSIKEAKKLILRGHGTCLSARTLLSRDLEIPGKYFSIARCYRPEIGDKTHLTEFNQVEGIVIDKDLTLRDLLGVLEKFALEIAGADKVKFRPDYFPFTEPSVELAAYKKGYGWIEFGGSGIFRPEVTLPLGVKEPVIAWGLGIDRLFMMRANIDDIQAVFSHDLGWLRKKEVI